MVSQLSKYLLVFFFVILNFLTACTGGEMSKATTDLPAISDIAPSFWEELSKKRIYFGHQSVGQNILVGVKMLMEANSHIQVNLIETHNPADFNDGIFAHSNVGENRKPKSKIDSFAQIIESDLCKKANIAFFKFCYVDIDSKTDLLEIFEYYKKTMSYLKQKYPNIVFIHVTVPLRTVQSGIKVPLKKLVGKPVEGYCDNISRNDFNKILISEYGDKQPIFDLAMIESISPDGRRSSFSYEGKTYYSLFPEYTNDGGHLNDIGSRKVAEQLLVFLANLSHHSTAGSPSHHE